MFLQLFLNDAKGVDISCSSLEILTVFGHADLPPIMRQGNEEAIRVIILTRLQHGFISP